MKMFTSLLLLCFCLASHAETKYGIAELLRLNSEALKNTPEDAPQLDEVAHHLHAALSILENGYSPEDNGVCIEYVTNTYKSVGYSTLDSMDKALLDCKKIKDIEIVKFTFGVYKTVGYSTLDSLDKATQVATVELMGKGHLLKFAYEKYKSVGYSTLDSLDKAIVMAGPLKKGSVGCINAAFTNYKSVGYSTLDSMDKAVQACN